MPHSFRTTSAIDEANAEAPAPQRAAAAAGHPPQRARARTPLRRGACQLVRGCSRPAAGAAGKSGPGPGSPTPELAATPGWRRLG